jgi:hypothetical protein
MSVPVTLLCAAAFGLSLLLGRRVLDSRQERHIWRALVRRAGRADGVFTPDLVTGLPEAAQRYFKYSIRTGSTLYKAVEVDMGGELGFGNRDQPRYRPMSARQLLAPPHGLVWRVRTGLLAGSDGISDGVSWTRFWLAGLLPVVRVGDNADHYRSALGRVVAEAAIWAPASLLPGKAVRWEEVDAVTARAWVTSGSYEQAVDITVAADGQPTCVLIQRWSNENPEKVFRLQPFGGQLSAFQDFSGYRLPTRVEGGNHFGEQAYFPFFKARVTAIRFPLAR